MAPIKGTVATMIAVADDWDVWNALFAGRQTKLHGIDLVDLRPGGSPCTGSG